MPPRKSRLAPTPPTSTAPLRDTFEVYLTEIGRVPLLAADEERKLLREVQAGRRPRANPAAKVAADHARDHLVRANLRLVVSMAKWKCWQGRGLTIPELVAEGNVGLLQAADRFELRHGVRFSTYAGWWIRQAMGRAIDNTGSVVRVPSNVCRQLGDWLEAKERLRSELEREPKPAEVAESLGWSDSVAAAMDCAERAKLFCGPPGDRVRFGELGDEQVGVVEGLEDRGGGGGCVGSASGGSVGTGTDSRLEPDELAALTEAVRCLPERQRQVIQMRFGLCEEWPRPMTLLEIGRVLRVSRERVRQIERNGLDGLREELGGRD